MSYKIYHEDCLNALNNIDNGSVDLILTDPPYNISQKSNFHTMGRTGVDFGEWDKEFDQQTWLNVALKKVKKGGSVIIFNDWKNIGELREVLEKNDFILKGLLHWTKSNPMPRNRDRLYVTNFEVAIWAVNKKGWTFNRQKQTYETGFFEYPVVNGKKRIHPTQKPVELIEDILKIHSNVGDTVLDCFMGSGSIGIACLKNDRNYIGIELDENYFNLAKERLEKFQTE